MTARRRAVVVSDEYLDGITGMSVQAPSEYDRECRLIPVALLEVRDAAAKALDAAEQAIREAWATAAPRRNPKFNASLDDD